MFAKAKAKVIAIKVVNKYKRIALPPILPNEVTFPRFVTPQTIEKNTTGTINIFNEEIKRLPKTFTVLTKFSDKLGIKIFVKLPEIIPSNSEINILLVNDI